MDLFFFFHFVIFSLKLLRLSCHGSRLSPLDTPLPKSTHMPIQRHSRILKMFSHQSATEFNFELWPLSWQIGIRCFIHNTDATKGKWVSFYPASASAHCDPQTFSTSPATSRDVGSGRRGLGGFSVGPSRLDSSRVTASSAVSQAQVRIDTLATLLTTHGTNPTFSRKKQCTYSADSLQTPQPTSPLF